jgi:O-antigen/teichoic acid export membrane protein
MVSIAFPLAVGTTLLAEPIIRTFVGDTYVPYSVVALQILAWTLPFSFVNGLLQYVLIAANQQRFITASFILAAIFNVTANLMAIPRWSFVGAAITTVASEVILLGPFWLGTQRFVGPVRLGAVAWRPALASAIMAGPVWLTRDTLLVATLLGACTYVLAMHLLGGIGQLERSLLRQLNFARGR